MKPPRKQKLITFQLSPEMSAWLEAQTMQRGTNKSEVIRACIKQAMEQLATKEER